MITLKQWMELVGYRITEGSEYQWKCFGPNAYILDFWNGQSDVESVSSTVVFDTVTQVVYEAATYDGRNSRAYRLINPAYKKAMLDEALARNVSNEIAWDEVSYTDLESVEDFIDKGTAIIHGQDYDPHIVVPVRLDTETVTALSFAAHVKGMTQNQLIEQVLAKELEGLNNDQKKQIEI